MSTCVWLQFAIHVKFEAIFRLQIHLEPKGDSDGTNSDQKVSLTGPKVRVRPSLRGFKLQKRHVLV